MGEQRMTQAVILTPAGTLSGREPINQRLSQEKATKRRPEIFPSSGSAAARPKWQEWGLHNGKAWPTVLARPPEMVKRHPAGAACPTSAWSLASDLLSLFSLPTLPPAILGVH
jgi:hypothetical protein